MSNRLKEQLKELRDEHQFTPDASWVADNKAALMARIASETATDAQQVTMPLWQYLLPQKMLVSVRSIATLVIVSIVSVVGWTASVSASYQSIPGDLLYGVKIATEKTQIAFAGVVQGSEKKATLLNNAAKTRAYETKVLIAQKKSSELVEDTLEALEETVEEAKKSVSVTTQKKSVHTAKAVAELAQSNGIIAETLGDAIEDVSAVDVAVVEKVVNTTKTVTAKSLEAAKEIVVKKQEGGLAEELSDEDVQDAVGEVINSVNASLEGTSGALKKVLEGVQKSSTSTPPVITVTTTPPVVSTTTTAESTDETADKEGSATTDSGETKTVEQVAEGVAEEYAAARQLVDEGKLVEALDKALSVTETNNVLVKEVVKLSQKEDQAEAGTGETTEPSTSSTPSVVEEDEQATSTTPAETVQTPEDDATTTSGSVNG